MDVSMGKCGRAEELELLDDLCGALEYFEAKKPGAGIPAAQTFAPTAEATQPPSPASCEVRAAEPLDAQLDFTVGVPLSYTMVRRAPVGLDTLLELPDPELSRLKRHAPEPSLFLQKTERLVHELVPEDEKERRVLRELLRKNRHRVNRAKVMALIRRGLQAREVATIHEIRQHCRDFFHEFNRQTIWGSVYAQGAQTTISWELAEEFWKKGLYQRGELYRFFSALCTYLESDPGALKRGSSATNLAGHALHHGLPPREPPCVRQTERLVQQAVYGRPSRGESMVALGRPGVVGELFAGNHMLPKREVLWNQGLRAYQVYLPCKTWTEIDLADVVWQIARVEAPVTRRRLATLSSHFHNSVHFWRTVSYMVSIDILAKIDKEFWLKRDLDYCLASGTGVARIPCAPGPGIPLSDASLFDTGLGLRHLHSRFEGPELDRAIFQFFRRWNVSASQITPNLALLYLHKFEKTYGKVTLRSWKQA